MPDRQSTAAPHAHTAATGDELRQRVQNFTRLTNPDLARILDGESSQKLSALERPSAEGGHSLAHEIARHGPISAERACALFEHCLEALARAHHLGLVHGGLRPANLWLEPHDDGLRLRLRHQEGEPRAQTDRHEAPRYFSPEYIRTGRVTEATDIYQIALCLGEAMLGEPLAQGADQVARIQAHLEGRLQIPPWLRESPLGKVLTWALHPDPAQRLPDALRFRRELRALRLGDVTDTSAQDTDPDLKEGPRPPRAPSSTATSSSKRSAARAASRSSTRAASSTPASASRSRS
jgi:serine/threonine protein kinase